MLISFRKREQLRKKSAGRMILILLIVLLTPLIFISVLFFLTEGKTKSAIQLNFLSEKHGAGAPNYLDYVEGI